MPSDPLLWWIPIYSWSWLFLVLLGFLGFDFHGFYEGRRIYQRPGQGIIEVPSEDFLHATLSVYRCEGTPDQGRLGTLGQEAC